MNATIRVQRKGKNRVAFIGKSTLNHAVLTAEGATADEARQNLLDKLHKAAAYSGYSNYRRVSDGTLFRLSWAAQSACFAYEVFPVDPHGLSFTCRMLTDEEGDAWRIFRYHVAHYEEEYLNAVDAFESRNGTPFFKWAKRDITHWELRRTGYSITEETAVRAAEEVEHKPETVTAVYDLGDSANDRYTVVMEKLAPHVYAMFCINSVPFHPSHGVFQFTEGDKGPHLGKKLDWLELPPIVRWAVIQRLRVDDTPETSEETNG